MPASMFSAKKPLALEPADCDRVLAVAQNIRHRSRWSASCAVLTLPMPRPSRRLTLPGWGKVFHIACASHDPVTPHGFFVCFAPTSGGIFLDCCIHDIDLVRWMLDGAEALDAAQAPETFAYRAYACCHG